MKAIILAAGRGSRLKKITKDQPKCMVSVRGKPLLHWQIEALNAAGIDEIGVVSGYQKEKIRHPNIKKVFSNNDWATTNMVCSLFCADEWLTESECIISYSDIFYESNIVTKLKEVDASLAITYDEQYLELWKKRFSNPLEDLETFRIDEKSNLLEIGKKANRIEDIEGQYMGLSKTNPESWSAIKDALPKKVRQTIDFTRMLQLLIEIGRPIKAVNICSEIWGEVDNPYDLNVYNQESYF